MRQSTLVAALAVGVLCAGCGQHSASAPGNATAATTPGATAADDPEAQCKSWGIQPGSAGYKQCVDGMTEAANATAGAGGSAPQNPAQLQAETSRMREQAQAEAAQMRQDMAAEMKAAASNPNCTTTTHGTNTSTTCP